VAVEEEVSVEVAAVAVDEAVVVVAAVADSEEEADSVAAVVVEAVEVDEDVVEAAGASEQERRLSSSLIDITVSLSPVVKKMLWLQRTWYQEIPSMVKRKSKLYKTTAPRLNTEHGILSDPS